MFASSMSNPDSWKTRRIVLHGKQEVKIEPFEVEYLNRAAGNHSHPAGKKPLFPLLKKEKGPVPC